MAAASFSSGQILANWGWEYVNWVIFPPIFLVAALMGAAGAFSGDQSRRPRRRGRNPSEQRCAESARPRGAGPMKAAQGGTALRIW